MPLTQAIGYEGNITLPTGRNANINQWSASISRVSSDVTGFGDDGRARRYGLMDMTGQAQGNPEYGAASTAPGGALATTANITLTVATGCTYVAGVGIVSTDVGSAKDGDATITFNFELADGALVAETWATT